MNNVSQRPLLVFQGEYGISEKGILYTTAPTICKIVTVFDPESKKAFLAHVDEYTSIPDTVQKVTELFDTTKPLLVRLMGGCVCDQFSIKNKKEFSAIFEILGLSFETIPLKGFANRPQILLNGNNGQLDFLEDANKDPAIEFFQKNEFFHFNRFLDKEFSGIEGFDIPDFRIKKAERVAGPLELDCRRQVVRSDEAKKILLQFLKNRLCADKAPDLMKASLEAGDLGRLLRLSCVDQKYTSVLNFLLTFQKDLNINPNANTTPSGTALDIASRSNNLKAVDLLKTPLKTRKDLVLKNLEEIILRDRFVSDDNFVAPFYEGDLNQFLRNVSKHPNAGRLMKVLCENMQCLSIDPKARDEHNGQNALELALSCRNAEVIKYLKPFYNDNEVALKPATKAQKKIND